MGAGVAGPGDRVGDGPADGAGAFGRVVVPAESLSSGAGVTFVGGTVTVLVRMHRWISAAVLSTSTSVPSGTRFRIATRQAVARTVTVLIPATAPDVCACPRSKQSPPGVVQSSIRFAVRFAASAASAAECSVMRFASCASRMAYTV